MLQDRVEGTYTGNAPLRIGVQLPSRRGSVEVHASIDGRRAPVSQEEARIFVTLPATDAKGVCRFEIVRSIEAKE
jgi:hypothetical protein